ncbi:MAG TPA: HAMP domain-containing sensor histidine kinase [Polyangiaceae bacterium]|jgi:two-component system phosphate regulon sensor histidine kinase PhoR|nr:MAG: Signal-transduction histidine kinase senX3 [Deltaproteobacteria bacterium ADurb.Bin207]HNS95304.1 HAMP domain-containing sensor histidine kinase [Polyangiaceae bacterium]HNZ23140.1 HAMP domain-containing sensor histidine kinase [Polyangiaceae bacterium]HOD22129.1 HAMP domain-containing sensor histidine kinase [Polyangiaceae bacterium]HOE49421.1 HAMP domain-containing sensor histidine kinase [Polyangiaceae bacterium]
MSSDTRAIGETMRDWLRFTVIALTPALAMGWIGLRALQGQEDATRREIQVTIEAMAKRMVMESQTMTRAGSNRLRDSSLPTDPVLLENALRSITPAIADAVVLSSEGELLIPARKAITSEPKGIAPPRCGTMADELARSRSSPSHGGLRDDFMHQCQEYRSVTGRWVWPLIAMESFTPEHADGLASWMESHASSMRPSEREATMRASLALPTLTGPARKRVLTALSADSTNHEAVRAVLPDPNPRPVLHDGATTPEIIEWNSDASIGYLKTISTGMRAGFVIHAASVRRAMAHGWSTGSADYRVDLIETPAEMDRDTTPFKSVSWITPSLGVQVSLADPLLIDRRTSRARIVLAGVGVGAMVVAFVLAAFLFARMRAARKLSSLRAGFVSTVSHELRTPLASLRMLSELLEENRVPEDEKAEVHAALSREAKRLGETVDRLLGFSRMSAGRYSIVRKEGLVFEPIHQSVMAFRDRHPDLAVEVEVERDMKAQFDDNHLRLALDNLLENAAKYAPSGTPYRVVAREQNAWIVIDVIDRGPGIRRSDVKRIFEPFVRGDDRLSSAVQGSGIGLSLVRQVAQAHHGHAEVMSEPGKGATFRIRFPRSES